MLKKYLVWGAALAVLAGGLFAFAPHANAVSTFKDGGDGNVTLAKSVVHDGAYYVAGQDITIDGTINGDLYCGGQTVRINGTVNGDVLCAAQKIVIDGVVSQDVRSAAQIITVTGKVGGTMTGFAQDIEIAKTATIGGDLNGAAQNVTVDGTVKRDVAVAAEKLAVSGLIEGSAVVGVDSLSLTSTPAVVGGLEYTSPTKQSLDDKSVTGKVTFNQSETTDVDQQQAAQAAAKAAVFALIAFVFSAVVLSLFIPRTFERSYELVRKKSGMVALVGIAAGLGLPVVAGMLFLTVIGIPLGLLTIVGLVLLWLLAFPFAAYYLGRALFGRVIHNVLLLMLAGAVLLGALLLVPVLNVIVFMVMMVAGIGGVIMTMTNGYQKPSYQIAPDAEAPKKK